MNCVMLKRAISVVLVLAVAIMMCFSVEANNETQMIFRCNAKSKDKIALTFDDGPHPIQTKKILKILEKHDVKATFFTIGVNIDHYSEALKQVSNAEHEIGNHTNSHSQLKSMPTDKIESEINECDRKVEKITGRKTMLIRPPCGMYDAKLVNIAAQKGYKIILWNIDTRDWAHCGADEMSKNVINNVKGGDIILFHDYISGKTDTVKALDKIIPALKAKGYEFVTVSELLKN